MISYRAHEAYWLANTNNRSPTPIDGAWHLVQSDASRPDVPQWIYFEYNRAHMAVFGFSNGRSEIHDFRIDAQRNTLNISNRWLSPGSDVFTGTWKRNRDQLKIDGIWHGEAATGSATFQRKEMAVKDHQ